jgi:tetratricopeptide (TPR) repeat protein
LKWFLRNAALRSGDGSYNLRDMSFIRLGLLSLVACLVWTGCPPADRKVDEEKDSWYIMGETRQSSMDYEGAVEQFLKALEVNPHSGSAHKKLGTLYEKDIEVPDYAAAIYHYQRLLPLHPDDRHADIIRDSIGACRQELAAEVGLVPLDQHTDAILSERDALLKDVKKLREENRQLRDALAKRGAGGTQIELPPIGGDTSALDAGLDRSTTMPKGRPRPKVEETRPEPPIFTGARAGEHVVQSGDNFYRIGLKYGVSAAEMQAANPGVNASTMKLGTMLRIPRKR